MTVRQRFQFAEQAISRQEETKARGESDARADLDYAGKEGAEQIRRVVILECGITGPGEELLSAFPRGTELGLQRNPAFPGDRWNIRVLSPDGFFLGCLPTRLNQSTARLMDAGKRIRAYVEDAADSQYRYNPAKATRGTGGISISGSLLRVYMELPIGKEEEHES